MKNLIKKASFLAYFLIATDLLMAQSVSAGSRSDYWIYLLLAAVVLLLFFFIFQVSDNLLAIEAKKSGVDGKANFSIFPSFKELFGAKLPDYAAGEEVIRLTQGFDINLEGEAEKKIESGTVATRFAVQPGNFIGMSPIPKVTVEVGDEVLAGDVLFYDKKLPEVKYVAPVSGEVIAVNRGAKRSIAEVVILADKTIRYKNFPAFDLNSSRTDLVNYMMEAGVWPMILERPFKVVPDPTHIPRDIFVSTFDSAPLAPDNNLVVSGKEAAFQKGLDVLGKLTPGNVYLGLNAKDKNAPSPVFTKATGVVKRWFHGKHPAGNVGIQIHNTRPIGPSDKVWVLGVQEVITIGQLFLNGIYDASRIIVLGGAELNKPAYVNTFVGANIGELVNDRLTNQNVRIISGDVLSGDQKTGDQFLDFHDDQVTVIQEGDYFEMFGWLLPTVPRPSISTTYPNFLFPGVKFKGDTNTHGEKRAFVVTGQYEKVLPMDIFPQHLMKAILVRDFEQMEGLGIHELAEEDIALCEFVCTSKQPLQKILKEGLDIMREQG